jgi:MFS family permease
MARHRSLGFNRTTANALASVGSFIALLVVFLFALLSDRSNKRGLAVAIAITCYLVTLIVARTTGAHVGKWGKWGLWTAVNAFAIGYHPIHNTWLQLNCSDPAERSISIACVPPFRTTSLLPRLGPGLEQTSMQANPLLTRLCRMWVMSANTGLMYGTQYFQADDKPLYHRGLTIMIGVVLGGLMLIVLQETVYYFHNKHVVMKSADHGPDEPQEQLYTL